MRTVVAIFTFIMWLCCCVQLVEQAVIPALMFGGIAAIGFVMLSDANIRKYGFHHVHNEDD